MKSKKAIEYLAECVRAAAPLHPDDVGECDLKLKDAKRAVKIAEEELTRWRDPKEEKPEEGEWVLLKIDDLPQCKYVTAFYFKGQWQVVGKIFWGNVTAWRPIQE